jgi:hypothetical protein
MPAKPRVEKIGKVHIPIVTRGHLQSYAHSAWPLTHNRRVPRGRPPFIIDAKGNVVGGTPHTLLDPEKLTGPLIMMPGTLWHRPEIQRLFDIDSKDSAALRDSLHNIRVVQMSPYFVKEGLTEVALHHLHLKPVKEEPLPLRFVLGEETERRGMNWLKAQPMTIDEHGTIIIDGGSYAFLRHTPIRPPRQSPIDRKTLPKIIRHLSEVAPKRRPVAEIFEALRLGKSK